MMLALSFVSNHSEKPLLARMPPLVMLICVMMASVLNVSEKVKSSMTNEERIKFL